jgi:hypothetical protein
MRPINGKLTAADRSGALCLLAHNPMCHDHGIQSVRRQHHGKSEEAHEGSHARHLTAF